MLGFPAFHAICSKYEYWCGGRSMSVVRKTITLTEQQNDWVKMRIGSADETRASQPTRELIPPHQEHRASVTQLRMLLDEGKHSGVSQRSAVNIVSTTRKRMMSDRKL